MEMKSHIRNIFIILATFNLSIPHAQNLSVDELMSLGKSMGIGNSEQNISEDQNVSNEGSQDDLSNNNENSDREKFIEFGYQGSDDFITAPNPKKLEPLNYFGYDFFTKNQSYTPSVNLSVPSNYILGPGDTIKAILYGGGKSAQYTLNVNRDGSILFPEIGPMPASGITLDQFQETINLTFSTQFIGTKVSITVDKIRSINIFVLGDASTPGMFTINALSTLTNAIFASGGVRTSGSLRNIELKRAGKTITTFDFYDLLLNGDTSKDVILKEGDVVFIPPIGKTVGIAGAINRPAIYELKDGQTSGDLIALAGSFKPNADRASIEIERISQDGAGFNLLNVDIRKNNREELINGDLLKVYTVNNNMNNAVLFKGHVSRPGFYPWRSGMTLEDIIPDLGSLLPMTDQKYVLLKRESKKKGDFSIFQINLEEHFSIDEKLPLEEKDELIFFPRLLSFDLVTANLKPKDALTQEERNELLGQFEKSFINPQTGLPVEQSNSDSDSVQDIDLKQVKNNKFYEYKIYQYCALPEMLGQNIVKYGMDLGNTAPAQSSNEASRTILRQTLTNLGARPSSDSTDESLLTNLCRRQLLHPLLNLVKRQSTPSNSKRIVSILGNVFFPGDYPLADSMTLNDSLMASGGLQESTYTTEIEVIRTDLDGKDYTVSTSTLDDSMMTSELKSDDVIHIKEIPKDVRIVSVSGEVFFPGSYPVSKNESLRSLLNRAGGFKNDAFPKAAVFQRESIADAERKRFAQAQSEIRRKLILASQTQGFGESAINSGVIDQLERIISVGEATGVAGRLVVDIE